MKSDKVIINLRSLFRKSFPEYEFYLYGSRARGDNRDDSDYDVLGLLPDDLQRVDFESEANRIYDNICRLQIDNYDELNQTMPDISLMLVKKKEWGARRTPFTVNVTNDRLRL